MAASSHAEHLLSPIGPYLVAYVSSPYLALKASGLLSAHTITMALPDTLTPPLP